MQEYLKPLPTIDERNSQFWHAAKQHQLQMQRCSRCGHIRYPVNEICPACLSPDAEWMQLSGRAEILSYIVFHQVYNAAFAEDVPYNVALIQLEEGPRMFSNIVGTANGDARVGDKVELVFDDVTPEVSIPRFRLRKAER